MTAIQHILVAADFSPASHRAVEVATRIAARAKAKVTVLHVFEPPPYPYIRGVAFPLPRRAVDRSREDERRQFEALMSDVRSRQNGANVVQREGPPWQEILSSVDKLAVDLLVMGTRDSDKGPAGGLGSVTERVLRLSPVPVLTVRGARFESRARAGRDLAKTLFGVSVRKPMVVAISRGGVVVGDEIALALGASLDVLLTQPVQFRGKFVGAICERANPRFDRAEMRARMSDAESAVLLRRAREALDEQVRRLEGPRALGDFRQRAVLVVTDRIAEPWTVMAAADAVEALGAHRIVVTAPVGADKAVATLRAASREVVVLETMRFHADAESCFRDSHDPTDMALLDRLRRPSADAA